MSFDIGKRKKSRGSKKLGVEIPCFQKNIKLSSNESTHGIYCLSSVSVSVTHFGFSVFSFNAVRHQYERL